jgi:hypothetical protein
VYNLFGEVLLGLQVLCRFNFLIVPLCRVIETEMGFPLRSRLCAHCCALVFAQTIRALDSADRFRAANAAQLDLYVQTYYVKKLVCC